MNKKLKKFILFFFPIKNRIVFESNPEFSCNARPVYKEMLHRGINKKYAICWLVEDKNKYKNDKSGNKYFNYEEHGFGKIKKLYILITSKVLIFTNRFLIKYRDEQLVVNLMHGSPLKRTHGYIEYDTCDYVITESNFFNKGVSEALEVPYEKTIGLGFPRTDIFGENTNALKKLGIDEKLKVIVWMPTFRKNKNSGIECGELKKLGVPLLDSFESFKVINERLIENNILLVIKLHPAEDTSNMQLCEYSNIFFLNDKDLGKKNVTVYELLSDSTALLTDYSSVYYDYLYMNKPIGLVIDDLEEFNKKNGFVYGNYKDFIKGSYIENLDDFISFIDNIGEGKDVDKEEREWAINRYCGYRDFKATKRVVDFILDKLS